ncbi:MAG: hypothetical protein J7M38_04910, partial [Armatimonadetes bacterium]|nr:hypothetical protein [Armatimonadota bacterium]
NRGILQRVALTPTDLMHISGEFAPWNTEAAQAGLEAFAALFGAPSDEVIARTRETMTRTLCRMLMATELGEEVDLAEETARSETLAAVIERLLSPDGDEVLRLNAHYRRPVVAIGAPAHVFLPPVGRRLGCEVIVPEDAGVANAVGAVVSNVSITETVAVRPGEFDGFTVYAPDGRYDFEALDDATGFAAEEAAKNARRRALSAGAADPLVEVDVEPRHGRLSTGEEQLIEVRVRATAWGPPLAAGLEDAAAG